ncbi:hypothetical protein [Desulfobacter postgatei]|uniref:hypothetical protein n=1 Tax=Desulfobacter postgatei TaxID=2293 RepID=UPI00259B05A0|nr:hypothetical protein [uncultured Desulfobacter sp.]
MNKLKGDSLNPSKRIILLILIMSILVATTTVLSISILYKTAIREEMLRLAETAKSQARLIEAVARFNTKYSTNYPSGSKQATLSQIKEAHAEYVGFGITGEFTLAEKRDDQIVFLLSHRHYDLDNPKPVQWDSNIAEPMRAALSGKSGTIVGRDYRGVTVLAAHEPVADLDMGIVAKIDLSEVRTPFLRAAIITGIFASILILIGVSIFFKLTNPILIKLNKTVEMLQNTLKEVKVLRGILPICSFCKKIRDDAGCWNQLEVYVKEHSDADFSHGICPDCFKTHYPEEYKSMQIKNQTKHNKANSADAKDRAAD